MASRPPPRFVVRTHDEAGQRRRWLWLGLAWLASLLVTAWLARGLELPTLPGGPILADRHEVRRLTRENDELRQEAANLRRSKQVAEIATEALRGSLTEREEEIAGLRTDLGFYSRLVGGDAQRQGLKVQEVRLRPVRGSPGWDLALSLTQNVKRGQDITGTVTVSVEGLQGNKVVRLDWPALGDAEQKDGLPFRFRYFQQLHATLVLPAQFRPTQLAIHVQPQGAVAVDRTMAWGDALSGSLTTDSSDEPPGTT